jgi:hypothetical protein
MNRRRQCVLKGSTFSRNMILHVVIAQRNVVWMEVASDHLFLGSLGIPLMKANYWWDFGLKTYITEKVGFDCCLPEFWDVTERRLVKHGCFGTTYRTHIEGLIVQDEKSVTSFKVTSIGNYAQCVRAHQHSLKSSCDSSSRNTTLFTRNKFKVSVPFFISFTRHLICIFSALLYQVGSQQSQIPIYSRIYHLTQR